MTDMKSYQIKTWIVFILIAFVMAGCAVYKKRKLPEPTLPPSPPGLKATTVTTTPTKKPTRIAPSYVPTDFALTSVQVKPYGVVLAWQNGAPPFQPQVKTAVNGAWINYGPITSHRSITNPPPVGSVAFFRVQSLSTPAPGTLVWLRSTPSANAAVVNKLKVDHLGNVVAVGSFYGTVNFGGVTLVSAGAADTFVAKYNAQGALQWANRVGGNFDDFGKSVAVDTQGNIVAAGEFFSASLNIGATNQSAQNDIYAVKFTPSGQQLWSRAWGSVATDFATDVGVDSGGNAFIASRSGGTVNFGSGISIIGFGGTDIAIAKLSSASGATLWARLRGGGSHDSAWALAVDAAGDVVVSGDGGGDFGNGMNVPNGFFVAKYANSDGGHRWHRTTVGGTGYGVTTTATGNVIATGSCSGATDFGGGPIAPGSPGKLFLTAWNLSGNFLWSAGFGGSPDRGLAVDWDSDVLVLTGQVNSSVNFGGGNSFGGANCFVATFTASGLTPPVWRWDKRAQGGGSGGNGVAIDTFGHVVNGGFVSGTADFGDGNIVVGQGSVGAAFLVQYVK